MWKNEGLTAVVKSLMDVEGRNQGRLICLKKKGPFSLTTGKIQDGTCRKFGGVLPNSLSVIFRES